MIDIQNIDDNECFKWCLARCLYPAGHHRAKSRKVGNYFAKERDFQSKLETFTKIEEKKEFYRN